MSRTNYGNGYKFQAIMNSRTNKSTVNVQFMKKDGTWGKTREAQRFGCETDEQVVKRLASLNSCEVRLADKI